VTNSISFSATFRGFIRKQGASPKNTPITIIGVPTIVLNSLRKKRGCPIKGKTRITLPIEIIETIIHPKAGYQSFCYQQQNKRQPMQTCLLRPKRMDY
jgi:hypothetical protein